MHRLGPGLLWQSIVSAAAAVYIKTAAVACIVIVAACGVYRWRRGEQSAAAVTGATCKARPGSAAEVRSDGGVPRIGGGMQIDCGSVRIFGSGSDGCAENRPL